MSVKNKCRWYKRPVVRTCAPSRAIASASIVAAGKTSVSITTGDTLGSSTRMSGRLALPLSIPVFSDLTIVESLQARLVSRRTAAKASFIVCSVVGIPVLAYKSRRLIAN